MFWISTSQIDRQTYTQNLEREYIPTIPFLHLRSHPLHLPERPWPNCSATLVPSSVSPAPSSAVRESLQFLGRRLGAERSAHLLQHIILLVHQLTSSVLKKVVFEDLPSGSCKPNPRVIVPSRSLRHFMNSSPWMP